MIKKNKQSRWEYFEEKHIVSDTHSVFRKVIRTVEDQKNLVTGHYEDEMKLMASAPEMLDALIIIYKTHINYYCEACDSLAGKCWCICSEAKEVIEKATGMKIEDILKGE
jgi:hypothetical protein